MPTYSDTPRAERAAAQKAAGDRPPKPHTHKGDLANLPAALLPLIERRNWVVWRWVLDGKGRWTKPPYRADAPTQHAKSDDPATWCAYLIAVKAVEEGHADGIGFALTGTDIAALDLDHCYAAGAIDEWAQDIIARAPGAYVEVTASGAGLRIIGTGTGTKTHNKFGVAGAQQGAAIEVYRGAVRYITISGLQIGTCDELPGVDTLLDGIVAEHQARTGKSGNGAHHQGGQKRPIIDIIRNGSPEGDRSEDFARVVWSLAGTGKTVDEIEQRLAEHPNGIAARYAGRLRQEIERCYRKRDLFDTDNVERTAEWLERELKKSDEALAERARIDALARKSRLDYDRARKDAAAGLGVRAETLDKEVDERRIELEVEDKPLLYPHWRVEPWADPVETAALITALQSHILKYMVMTEAQALVCALWTMMAWVHDRSVIHSPYLMVTAPQRDSGKSTLLGLLGFLAPRAMVCVGLGEAVLFRSIDMWEPTLIADEADTLFADNEPLRAVFNSGWTRGAGVPRCVGDDHTPKMFKTFCPRAIGLKGKNVPDTTLSRCIIIELNRAKRDEQRQDFAHIDDDDLTMLRRQLARWADDSHEPLAKAQPKIPDGFYNRVRRNWWVLLAIAELAGSDYAEAGRKTAAAFEAVVDTTDIEIELLADIKKVFDGTQVDEITTKALITALCVDEERPWATFYKGKPITDRQLARMLGHYRIRSLDVHTISGAHAKGYKRDRLKDVWERYL